MLSQEHSNTLITINNSAIILKINSKNKKVIALMKNYVRKQKQVFGQDHQFTKESENTLNK